MFNRQRTFQAITKQSENLLILFGKTNLNLSNKRKPKKFYNYEERNNIQT